MCVLIYERSIDLPAAVLAGCTMHHPAIPPIPLVAKMTDFGSAAACAAADGVGWVFVIDVDDMDENYDVY